MFDMNRVKLRCLSRKQLQGYVSVLHENGTRSQIYDFDCVYCQLYTMQCNHFRGVTFTYSFNLYILSLFKL